MQKAGKGITITQTIPHKIT